MKKSVKNNNAYYTIVWSKEYPYDRHSASRILPEMAGLLCLLEERRPFEYRPLIFYGCWREGLRLGMKNFFDPAFSKYGDIAKEMLSRKLFYKYSVIDTTPFDLKDIMYWLIGKYAPEFNNLEKFKCTRRYENISVREIVMREGAISEHIPDIGF